MDPNPPAYEQIEPDQPAQPTQTTQQGSMISNVYHRLSESAHPVALVCYLAFRLAPLAIYIFGLWFTSNYILFFIIVILLLVSDFWNVKNIAGRLLVGLRWWNETTDQGQSVLVFETADPSRHINPIDSKMFWLFIYVCPVAWVVLGVVAIIKLHFLSLILVIIGVALGTTNAMAYTKCDHFGKANSWANGMLGSVGGSMLGRLNPLRLFR